MDDCRLNDSVIDQLSESQSAEKYRSAWPFPHVVIDHFLAEETLKEVYKEISSIDQAKLIHYGHYNENIFGTVGIDKIPSKTMSLISFLNSESFCQVLSRFTGFSNLISDSTLDGGGLMFAGCGGHMNLHTDYLSHPYQKFWKRRLNLLLYLSDPWLEEFKGDLFLCNKENPDQIKKIPPACNRFVLFETTKDTLHGLPEEIKAPIGTKRMVLSLWYYTYENKKVKFSTTRYRPMVNDNLIKKSLISIDNVLIRIYWLLKRNLGIGDKLAHNIISSFHWSKKLFSARKLNH